MGSIEELAAKSIEIAFSMSVPDKDEAGKNAIVIDQAGITYSVARHLGSAVVAWQIAPPSEEQAFLEPDGIRTMSQFNHAMDIATGKAPPDPVID